MYSLYWRSEPGSLRLVLVPGVGNLEGIFLLQPADWAVLMLARAVRDKRNAICIAVAGGWWLVVWLSVWRGMLLEEYVG